VSRERGCRPVRRGPCVTSFRSFRVIKWVIPGRATPASTRGHTTSSTGRPLRDSRVRACLAKPADQIKPTRPWDCRPTTRGGVRARPEVARCLHALFGRGWRGGPACSAARRPAAAGNRCSALKPCRRQTAQLRWGRSALPQRGRHDRPLSGGRQQRLELLPISSSGAERPRAPRLPPKSGAAAE
jgi:hypothetical protein